MIPESVPGELADEAVVLMKIVPGMREDHVWRKDILQFLKAFLNRTTNIRKKAVTEGLDDNRFGVGSLEEGTSAELCLLGTRGVGTQHHPVELGARRTLDQTQHCAPTPNLDVVAVGAQT